jgi:hypothetical protein
MLPINASESERGSIVSSGLTHRQERLPEGP